jgi:hypothetical protein
MSQLNSGSQRGRVDREAMILGCDLHPAGGKILDRVVAAVMAKL